MSFQFAMGQRVRVPGSEVQGVVAGRTEVLNREHSRVVREYLLASLNPDLTVDNVMVEESILVEAQPGEMVTLASSEQAISEARDEGLRLAWEKLMATGVFKVKAKASR